MTNSPRIGSLKRFGVVAAAFAAIIMVAGGSVGASAASKGTVFSKLSGKWKCVRGSCWIRPVNGAKERVGCRVRYKVGTRGKSITQSIDCRGSIRMTSSAKIKLRKRNRVSGKWTSYNNNSGRSSGDASGSTTSSKLYVGITSRKGSRGAMRATVSGKRHVVTLYKRKGGKNYVVGRLSLKR